MVIWKYQLDVRPNQLVYMPPRAKVLSLGVQNDYPVLWALVGKTNVVPPSQPRVFSVITTGEHFEWPTQTTAEPFDRLCEAHPLQVHERFIGTVTLGKDMTSGNPSAWYVAHVFEGMVNIIKSKDEDRREIAKELNPNGFCCGDHQCGGCPEPYDGH